MFWSCMTPCTTEPASKKNPCEGTFPAGDNRVLCWGWKEQLWSLEGQITAVSLSDWQLVGALQSCNITVLTWGNWKHFEGLCKMGICGLQWQWKQAMVLENTEDDLGFYLSILLRVSLTTWEKPFPSQPGLSPSFHRFRVLGSINAGMSQTSASTAGIRQGEICPAK